MRAIIDAIAIAGGLVAAIGVFLQFGIGFALIYAGLHATAFAAAAAIVHKDETADVSDQTE